MNQPKTNRPFVVLVLALFLGFLAGAPTAGLRAQDYPLNPHPVWRVSIKIMAPVNMETARRDIIREVDVSNQILADLHEPVRIDLLEVVDLQGISAWNSPSTECGSIRSPLEIVAKADPVRYAYRWDAINIYVVDCGDSSAGVYPEDGDVMVFHPYSSFLLGDNSLLLHEIGHFMSLRHTHGAAGIYRDVCHMVTPELHGDDGVTDTLPDNPCWSLQDMVSSFSAPGITYNQLPPAAQSFVDQTYENIMSYHNPRTIFTPQQMGRMMDTAETDRANVVDNVNWPEPQTTSASTFRSGLRGKWIATESDSPLASLYFTNLITPTSVDVDSEFNATTATETLLARESLNTGTMTLFQESSERSVTYTVRPIASDRLSVRIAIHDAAGTDPLSGPWQYYELRDIVLEAAPPSISNISVEAGWNTCIDHGELVEVNFDLYTNETVDLFAVPVGANAVPQSGVVRITGSTGATCWFGVNSGSGTVRSVRIDMKRRNSNIVLASATVPVRLPFPCPPPPSNFVRGDVDSNGRIDYSDYLVIAYYAARRGATPTCLKAADVDDNGWIDNNDALEVIYYLYGLRSAPSAPFPKCGQDPTPDRLSCVSYNRCTP